MTSTALIAQVTTALTKCTEGVYRRQLREFLADALCVLGLRIYEFSGHSLNCLVGCLQSYRADVAFSPEYGVGYVMLMNAESNLINEFTPDFWARCFKHLEQASLLAGPSKKAS